MQPHDVSHLLQEEWIAGRRFPRSAVGVNARQTRLTADCDMSMASAIVRVDQ